MEPRGRLRDLAKATLLGGGPAEGQFQTPDYVSISEESAPAPVRPPWGVGKESQPRSQTEATQNAREWLTEVCSIRHEVPVEPIHWWLLFCLCREASSGISDKEQGSERVGLLLSILMSKTLFQDLFPFQNNHLYWKAKNVPEPRQGVT